MTNEFVRFLEVSPIQRSNYANLVLMSEKKNVRFENFIVCVCVYEHN